MRLGKGTEQMPAVHGVREAEDLSEAMAGMLSRLAAAQQATTNSLQAAQDFAANAAHELRTPLTAMRADLDTLRIHDLPADERDEVVGDLSRAQRRVEAIITALGQLASGQLAQAEDREVIDVTDMLDRVARENMRRAATVEVVVQADEDIGTDLGLARRAAAGGGQPGAQRDRARRRHPHRAGRRHAAADGRGEVLTIVVDDNGRGLPAEEHETVHGPVRPRQHRGAGRFGAGAGAGRAAGGAARRRASSCRTVRSVACAPP